MKKLDELLQKEKEMKEALLNLQNEIQEEKNSDWRFSEDKMVLSCCDWKSDTLTLESNHDSWNTTKEELLTSSTPDKIGILNVDCTTDGVGLNLPDVKKLIDYLQEKVDFLENDEQNFDKKSELILKEGNNRTVTLKSNRGNDWMLAKESYIPLYLRVDDTNRQSTIGLSIPQMKKMARFLNDAINYLEK